MDTNLLAVNPSPLLTPWGSRSASPYPFLDANESAEEDMEVFHVTSGFPPIPSVVANIDTPGDSPTEGILPVGRVVKGHSFPGEKNEALVSVKLQKDSAASKKESGSLKAFVVIEPNNEKLSDPTYEAERARETSEVNMTGAKEPTGVKMDSAREPPGVKMAGGRDPSGVQMDSAKEPSGLKMELAEGNMEEIKTASVSDNREYKTSSWYIIEGANQDSGNEESVEGKQRTSKGQSSISAEMESERSEGANFTGVVKTKPFTPGHRRVASSPPSITVSSFENRPLSGGGNTCGVTYLDRSRSDSDISAHAKQTLDDSHVSKEVLLGLLIELSHKNISSHVKITCYLHR